ncbi:MAG TPA: hypothetical protein ENN19_02095 [Chloroflexi bacterium]|nr:hypothetical protein [Chloroflexota bacterium]
MAAVFAEENRFHTDLLPGRFQIADPIMTRECFDQRLTNPDETLLVAVKGERIVGVLYLLNKPGACS